MTPDLQSAERRFQSQLDRLEDLWAMELIDECGYRAGQRQAQIDCEAAIGFAHVVAEWEAAPTNNNGSRA